MLRSLILLLSSLLVVDDVPRQGQVATTEGKQEVVLHSCLVTLIEATEVPALETGTITELNVVKNFWYQDGHQIAKMDDRIATLAVVAAEKKLEASQANAADDIDVQFSKASLEVVQKKLQRQMDLNRKGAITSVELEETELEVKQASLALQRSEKEHRVAQISLDIDANAVEAAKESLKRHAIFAPHAGNVLEVYHRRGEWVQAGDPIVRVVDMSKLRVTASVSHSAGVSPGDFIGKPVTVMVTRDGETPELFQGVVESTDLVQKQDDHFTIVAVVENRIEKANWILKIEELVTLTVQL